MDDIPSLDDISRPGTYDAYSRQRLEAQTLSHLDKNKRQPTGWISTTSSLLRALQILFIEHREKGQLFIIRTAACQDMFSAAELRDHLPGLSGHGNLKMKSRNEFLVRGKVEQNAIVGCASKKSLQTQHLDTIAPSLGNLSDWGLKACWQCEFNSSKYRKVSTEILNAAVALAITLGTDDSLAMIKRFLGAEFQIYSQGFDDDRVMDVTSARELAQASTNECPGDVEHGTGS